MLHAVGKWTTSSAAATGCKQNTPAQKQDFVTCTSLADFPLKFCNCRWLENVPVCERVVNMIPQLTKYVAAVTAGAYPNPKTNPLQP